MSNTRIHLKKLDEATKANFKAKGHARVWADRPTATGVQKKAVERLEAAMRAMHIASNDVYIMMDEEMSKARSSTINVRDIITTIGRA